MKRLRVTIEGKVFEVLVEVLDGNGGPASVPASVPVRASVPEALPVATVPAPVAAPVAPAAASGAKAASAGDIVSPLAGKVVSIDVKPGQTVDEGTQVATLEAMKMNTCVFAAHPGRVSEVVAQPGDGVEEGAVLLRVVPA